MAASLQSGPSLSKGLPNNGPYILSQRLTDTEQTFPMDSRRSQKVASGLQTSSEASLAGGPSLMSSLWVATLPMAVGSLRDRTSSSRAVEAEWVWPLQKGSGRAEDSFSRGSRASIRERNLRGMR